MSYISSGHYITPVQSVRDNGSDNGHQEVWLVLTLRGLESSHPREAQAAEDRAVTLGSDCLL